MKAPSFICRSDVLILQLPQSVLDIGVNLLTLPT